MMRRKRLVPGASAIYLFDEGSGTTLTDYSGNGNHGTFAPATAAPTWTQYGLSFDGGDHVACGAVAVGGVTQVVSYAAIAFSTAAPISAASNTSAILNFSTSSSATARYGVFFGNATGVTYENEIVTILDAPDEDTYRSTAWCDAAATIAAGWHVLTINWNGSSFDIWIDASKKTTTTSEVKDGHATRMLLSKVLIGARDANGVIGTNFTGGVAAACLAPAPLSDAGIVHNLMYFAALLRQRGETPGW